MCVGMYGGGPNDFDPVRQAHHPHERIVPAWVDPDKAMQPMSDPDQLERWWLDEAMPRIRRKRK